ncbi:hypothetical protein IHE45_07G065200 [Dioscorea alata]|uniref:Uncharacterized protein n=1 Tax=Dioscorea alata TaxID=55571 RepID=A0ACB7VRK3_DIOAL|nr:hypothetical protein IHE45_07G065200 [Dioscorea alata]
MPTSRMDMLFPSSSPSSSIRRLLGTRSMVLLKRRQSINGAIFFFFKKKKISRFTLEQLLLKKAKIFVGLCVSFCSSKKMVDNFFGFKQYH